MLFIFAKSLLLTFSIVATGNLIWTKFFSYNLNGTIINKYLESAILGGVFLGLISFILNFILPLKIIFNNALFIFPILFLFLNYKKKEIFILFKLIVVISFISTLLLSYSNFYRPDAGWYHIPFVRLITDYKLIVGTSSLHWAFGNHSILQYLSAFLSNSITGATGMLYTNSILPSVFLLFFLYNFYNEKKLILKIFLFLIISIFFIEMNRYSEYGNDNLAHLYFFYLIYVFFIQSLKKEKISNAESSSKFFLLAFFGFFIKTTQIFTIFIPMYFFIKKKLFKKLKFYPIFSTTIFLLWITKNILISGCLIYPIQSSCIEKLSWYNSKSNNLISVHEAAKFTELLQKGYVFENKTIMMSKEDYLKDFNWLQNYFLNGKYKIVSKKFDLLLIFITFTLILSLILSRNFKDKLKIKIRLKELNIFLIFNITALMIIILKVPDGRFLFSYLVFCLFALTLFILNLFRKLISKRILYKSFNIMLVVLSIIFFTKNLNRILIKNESLSAEVSLKPEFNKKDVDFINVKINDKKQLDFIVAKSKNLYFSNQKNDCVYSPSPCIANIKILQNIKIVEKFSYLVLQIKK